MIQTRLIAICVFVLVMCDAAYGQYLKRDNTFDLNYSASYKDKFELRYSTKLAESQSWSMKNFTANSAFRLNPNFSMSYDLWRTGGSPIGSRYGLNYSLNKAFTSLNFSIFQTDGTPKDGIAGRLDLNMKFK